MDKNRKYTGIFPALYACYGPGGEIDTGAVRALARYLCDKGVSGLYVGGSSGECIYQSVEERKLVLEAVMEEVGGRLTVIAHVACNATRESMELAAHAESLGVDAIAAIPPIYFKLPPRAVAGYWNDISSAAPGTDFIIYNIPQLAGVALSVPLLREMLHNPRVIGVKNSSSPAQDIQLWRDEGVIVFNGPDEQLIAGLAAGAAGGIGGTYTAMPELYIRLFDLFRENRVEEARQVQNACCRVIYKVCEGQGNMYALLKEVLRLRGGPDAGGVRPPLQPMGPEDVIIAKTAADMIESAVAIYC